MTNPDPGLPVCEEETKPDSTQSHFAYHSTQNTSFHIEPINVILFGETSVGKSSVINLMAGRDVAETSSNLDGCTLQATEYLFTVRGCMKLLRVFDTAGLEESETDVASFISAIEETQKLFTSVKKTGRIDLLLFCIKAGRFTASMQRNYHLFSEILCNNQVPLALVVTHLEDEDVMENWWQRNERTFERHGIDAVAHACITALPTHVTLYAEKQAQSRLALQELFQGALGGRNPPSYVQNLQNWLVPFITKPLSLLTSRRKRNIVAKKLERSYCTLPRGEAQRLAKLIVKG